MKNPMMTLTSASHRCATLCALLALTGCVTVTPGGTTNTPVPATGTAVVERMLAMYQGKWFQTLQFTQENTRYTSTGRTERSQWKEYMLVPGRLRIEFMPAAGGNGAIYADGNVYSFEAAKLARTQPEVNVLLVLTADVYAQPASTTTRQLTSLGMDLSKLRGDTWNGRRVWVVGATGAADLGSPQFWVDAETWVVLRLIHRPALGGPTGPRPATEYRLSDYRTINGLPLVHEITFLRDGKPFFREQYTDVQLNTVLDARLFSVSQWRVPSRTP
jgi:outer membrane lipoprotein-sorting protein